MADVILFRPDFDYSVIGNRMPWGLLCLSAALIKNGYSVRIIDQSVNPDWKFLVLKEIQHGPLMFGVTSMTGRQIGHALDVSRFVRKHSNVPIVWGGVHASILPEQTLRNENIDYIVIGEGEETIIELAGVLRNERNPHHVKGIGFKEKDKVFINETRPNISLDNIPDIPYGLINVEKYVLSRFGRKRVLGHMTSRGCLHRCKYCYNSAFNKATWRSLSINKIFDNLHLFIDKYKITGILWIEDDFFSNKKRTLEIAERIIREKIDIKWAAQGRIDSIYELDQDSIALLKSSGCDNISLGVESGSDKILKSIGKDITKEQVMEVRNKLARNRIYQNYYFMIGLPHEEEEDRKETIDLIYKLAYKNKYLNTICGPATYLPYPGTELYRECVSMGFRPPDSLEGWINFDYYKLSLPWITKKERSRIDNIAWNIRGINRQFGFFIYSYFLYKLILLARFRINVGCFEKYIFIVGKYLTVKLRNIWFLGRSLLSIKDPDKKILL